MLTDRVEIRVRYAETDQMGVVYHGNYFTWFEVARVRMLEKYGQSYKEIEKEGYYMPVVEANARFRRPAGFDDILTIEATVKEKPGVRMQIDYRVLKEGKLICTGYTRHAFTDHDGIPKRPPGKFTRLVNQHYD